MKTIWVVLALTALCFATMAIFTGIDLADSWAEPDLKRTAQGPVPQALSTNTLEPPASSRSEGLISAPPKAAAVAKDTADSAHHFRNDYQALFQMGDYSSAIQVIEERLRQTPKNQALRRDLSVALYAAAFTDFERKDYAAAQGKLRRSLALGHAPARPALARILALRGEKAEALNLAEEHFQQAPDPDTLESLIDAHLNMENHEEAETLLVEYQRRYGTKEGSAPDPNDPSSAAVMRRRIAHFWNSRKKRLELRATLKESQLVIRRDGLELSFFEHSAERLADAVADALSSSLETLRARFGNLPWGAPMVVWLVKREEFRSTTGAPPWAGALFDGIMRLPYTDRILTSDTGPTGSQDWPHMRQMVYHESTHAYLSALCGNRIPSWLGEGLAQIHEGRSAEAARQALMQTFGRGEAWRTLQPDEDLSVPFTSEQSPMRVRTLYNRSLVLTHDLERRSSSGGDIWRRFLGDLCIHEIPFHDALEAAFGSREVETLWRTLQ